MKKLEQYINESLYDENINAFCILKPGFLQYENEWFDMIEQNNWYIENKKELTMTRQQAKTLYEPHKDKDFYDDYGLYDVSHQKISNAIMKNGNQLVPILLCC
jgi:nucleoside diphosphate kinase